MIMLKNKILAMISTYVPVIGIHVSGIGHPVGLIPPPQCIWSGEQTIGHMAVHWAPSAPIKIVC